MNTDKTLYTGRPTEERSEVEISIYDRLDSLGIEYNRADHDHADTMEDCLLIESVLGAKICKNLFLCNRQKTRFDLLPDSFSEMFHNHKKKDNEENTEDTL